MWLSSAGGVRIHGWWAAGREARVTTVFFHGNGGNLSHRVQHISEITAAGSDLLIIDYSGYGRSEGRPSEAGLYADAEAAYEWAAKQGKPVVIHGESLGSAVAVELAARARRSGFDHPAAARAPALRGRAGAEGALGRPRGDAQGPGRGLRGSVRRAVAAVLWRARRHAESEPGLMLPPDLAATKLNGTQATPRLPG